MSSLVGHVIAEKYHVVEFLGRGGMADVYKVWDKTRATFLAMKVLHENLAMDNVFIRRFKREAQNLAKLQHPNIVRFYDLEQHGELIYMLMEYVDGVTLNKASFRLKKPFTPSQALGIMQPICSALHYAHEMGLAHCDIKPANIMIDKTGRVLLTDFGIARFTEGATTATMVGAGTPAYMSPEQVNGSDPTPQTDIYALGTVLFELLAGGERPFTGETATITGTIGEKIRWEKRKFDAPSPRKYNAEINSSLEAVVLRCLQKDRRKRYSTVTAFLNELIDAVGVPSESLPPEIFVTDNNQTVQAPIASQQPRKKTRAFWGMGFIGVGFSAIGIVSILVLALVAFSKNDNPPPGPALVIPTPSPLVVTKIVEVRVTTTNLPTTIVEPTITSIPTKELPTNPPKPTSIPVRQLSVSQDSQGYIVVTGGPENFNDKFGPFPRGKLIVGPNNKFFVFVDDQGKTYTGRFGNAPSVKRIDDRSFTFQVVARHEDPAFSLSFSLDSDIPQYTLIIVENVFNQRVGYKIPTTISN